MTPFIQGVINSIQLILQGVMTFIQGVINVVSSLISGDWRQAFEGFKQIVKGAVETVLGIIGGIGSAIMGIFSGAATWLLTAGASIIGGLISGITSAMNVLGGFLGSIRGHISGFFSGAGSWLISAGKAILSGLLRGLMSAFGPVASFVSGIGGWIVRHKGPLSYDKVMLKPAGLAIMQGFDKSLKAGWKDVQRTVNGMNAQINGGFDVDASKTGRANVSNGGGSTTYVQQTFNYPAIAPTSISTQQKLQTAAMPQW